MLRKDLRHILFYVFKGIAQTVPMSPDFEVTENLQYKYIPPISEHLCENKYDNISSCLKHVKW